MSTSGFPTTSQSIELRHWSRNRVHDSSLPGMSATLVRFHCIRFSEVDMGAVSRCTARETAALALDPLLTSRISWLPMLPLAPPIASKSGKDSLRRAPNQAFFAQSASHSTKQACCFGWRVTGKRAISKNRGATVRQVSGAELTERPHPLDMLIIPFSERTFDQSEVPRAPCSQFSGHWQQSKDAFAGR